MKQSKANASLTNLVKRALRHDRRAISQLMSVVENDPQLRFQVLARLYWHRRESHVIGVTGPPGCGKSTLIAQLAGLYRDTDGRIAIVAVDPSSQITGGALLGDRIRMNNLASDSKVFIRSMATRGQFGGIARATEDAVRIFAATAAKRVIVETAGAGQTDVDIKSIADTTIVVMAPGLGDQIQALKAGIMEIGDIFVVNKADKDGADQTAQEIYSMVSMVEPSDGWRQRVIKTIATTGDGLAGLVEAISQHAAHTMKTKSARHEGARARLEILNAIKRYFEDIKTPKIESSKRFKRTAIEVANKRMDPYAAARMLVEQS